jgi:hypothetical protein
MEAVVAAKRLMLVFLAVTPWGQIPNVLKEHTAFSFTLA